MYRLENMELFKKPIAHRGLWDEKLPENSMGAFLNAAQKGFPSSSTYTFRLTIRSWSSTTTI